MEDAHSSSNTVQQPGAGGLPPIDNPGDLIRALNPENAGRTIRVMPGTYEVGVPLLVPDGATLQGAGVMQPEQGLPVGFQGTTTTTIKAGPGLRGNLLTLGDGSRVEKLVLEGLPPGGGSGPVPPEDAEGRWGNVVAVASRRPNVEVSATIEECVLINNLESRGGADGPTGGAILAYTRNPQKPPPPVPQPHENAKVILALTRSIVRTPKNGKAVFAMNFASGGTVTVKLTKNDIGGPLDVIGGLARPDAVRNATTTINSDGNHYSTQPGSAAAGWQITGGSTPPFPAGPNSNSESNTAKVESTNDQIENFRVGILAIGGRRLSSNHGTCSKNQVNLKLTRMKPAINPPRAATDFEFDAQSGGLFSAGDNNAVVVDVLAETPSDPLFHIDVHDAGTGTGNQLAFKGTLAAFTQQSP